jgi:hypothetical protein
MLELKSWSFARVAGIGAAWVAANLAFLATVERERLKAADSG